MIRAIIDKEMRELLSSSKFLFTFAVCAILIILSFFIGASNYKTSVSRWEAAKAENLRQMEGVTDWLRIQQTRIMLPPQPLATLVSGVSNDIGRTTEVEARGELSAYDSRYNEEPFYAVFRFLDLQFIFLIVLSLFAVLLGFDAISGEKERGTLKLALSNAVPRSTFILGKLIGSFTALSVSLLLAMGMGALLLPIMGVPMSGADWVRLGLIVLAGLLYFGVFLTLSVFVSSLTHRASSSFVILLVVWISAVMIIPRASVLIAGRAVDVPTVDELAAKKATLSSQLFADYREAMGSFKAPADKPESMEEIDAFMELFNSFMDSLTNIRDEKMNEYAARLNEDRFNRQQQQQAFSFALARLSPAASLSLASSELAETSLSLKRRYHDAATAYQKEYADFMKEKTGMNVGGRMLIFKVEDGTEQEEEPIDPSELPAFKMDEPPLSASLANASFDFGLLAFFNIFFFAASFVAFQRYDVR